MSNVWARLTGPKGDRPDPLFFATPIQSSQILMAYPYVRYDTSWTIPTVYVTQDGLCFLEGLVRHTSSTAIAGGTVLGWVPQGFRPYARTLLQGVCSSDGTNLFDRVDVDPDGTITFQAAAANSVWISMTGWWYRIDPWRNVSPDAMTRTGPDWGYSGQRRLLLQYPTDLVWLTSSFRPEPTPQWTPSVARAADSGTGGLLATHNLTNGTLIPMNPGWQPFVLQTPTSTAPQVWVATDGTNTAWRCTTAPAVSQQVYFFGYANTNFPVGSIIALFKNGVEIARTTVTKVTTQLGVYTETTFATNDTVSVQFYNPTGAAVNWLGSIQAGPGTRRPRLIVQIKPAEADGDYWVCPISGNYDIHYETCGGSGITCYELLRNRVPIASCTPGANSGTDDFTINTMDVTNIALVAGDLIGVGVLGPDYSSPSVWVNRVVGDEGTGQPYLRITKR